MSLQVVPPGKMFSLMTALLSPKVVETLEGRKDMLFQTLQERAGVLCVQPSRDICMLQGEWECMKKAHVVLEEFCLQVQHQNNVQALMHNAHNRPPSKEEIQKVFGLGNQSPDESHMKLYEEVQQRQMAYAQWAATALNHHMAAGAHLALQMQQQVHGGQDGRRSVTRQNEVAQPPREDTPLNLKKDLEPPHLDKYGGSQDDADSYRDEEEDEGDNPLTIAMSDEDEEKNGQSRSPNQRQNSVGIQDLSTKNSRSVSQDEDSKDSHMEYARHHPYAPNGSTANDIKTELNPIQAMTHALASHQQATLRDNAKYADPKAGMTAEGMLSSRIMSPGLPYSRQFHASQNSPAPDELAMRSTFMSPNYHLAAVELALLERRMTEPISKATAHDNDTEGSGRYTPDRQSNQQKGYSQVPLAHSTPLNDRDRNPVHKELAGWPPRPPGSVPESNMDDEHYYKCSACFAGFSGPEALQEHMMAAHAVGPGLSTEKSSSLLIAPTADAYCCPVCGKFYKSAQRLREHIPLHDKNYQRPTYPCPSCQKTFTYRHNMKVHFQKIHKGREPPKRHECTICGQKFHKPVYLRNHLLRHRDAPDTSALDYTLAPSPQNLPPVGPVPVGGPPVQGGSEGIGGEDTSPSGSPGTTTSE